MNSPTCDVFGTFSAKRGSCLSPSGGVAGRVQEEIFTHQEQQWVEYLGQKRRWVFRGVLLSVCGFNGVKMPLLELLAAVP